MFKRTPVNGFLILSIFFYVLTYHQEHQKTLKLVCKEELTFLILLQIISPVENDVILEDVPERTTTANSSVEEEVVDDQEDDQSGKSVNRPFNFQIKFFIVLIVNHTIFIILVQRI